MITFPSMVTTSKLEPAKNPLKTGPWYKLHFSTKPIKKPNKPKHIQVPTQGNFELKLQPGPRFELIDALATDGSATVQLPADTYQAYLRLGGLPSSNQPLTLSYEDPLYYVKDTLGRNDATRPPGSFTVQAQTPKAQKLKITSRCSSDPDSHRIWQISNPNPEPVTYDWDIKDSEQAGTEVAPPGDSYLETDAEPGSNVLQLTVDGKKQDNLAGKPDRCAPGQEPAADTSRWWNLGSRPIPVPADWHSEQGQNLVLKLGNQGVTDFTMRWVRTSGQQ